MFPFVDQFNDAFSTFAIVQCGDRGVTAAPHGWSSAPPPPPQLPAKDAQRALSSCTGPLRRTFPTTGELSGVSSGREAPSANEVQCRSAKWDPHSYAAGSRPQQVTTGDIVKSFARDFGVLMAAVWGSIPSPGMGITYVVKTIGKTVGIDIGIAAGAEHSVDDMARLMTALYQQNAASAADVAQQAADWAVQSAASAAASAQTGGAQAAIYAQQAKDAAERAQQHAVEAKQAAEEAKNAKTPKDLADASTRAVNAANAAKSDATEAAAAANSAEGAAKNEGGGTNKTPNPPGMESSNHCEELRRTLWDCEVTGWSTGECRALLDRLNHCPDMTLINPGENDIQCGPRAVDPDDIKRALELHCREWGGGTPAPGEDPCQFLLGVHPGGILEHTGNIHRDCGIGQGVTTGVVVAPAEDLCDLQPIGTVHTEVFCIPPPPFAPPPPCGTTGPEVGPGPLPRDLQGVVTSINGRELEGGLLLRDTLSWGDGSATTRIVYGVARVPRRLASAVAPTTGAPVPPNRYYGTVTVKGQPAPSGATVVAMVRSASCGTGTVTYTGVESNYVVDVAAATTQPGCGTAGAAVTFTVDGAPAKEIGTFQVGVFVHLDLTVP